ncbi:uncharacterized protein LOC132949788 [Metopolophium dirhodum]|uniref:uncharacterized protein LOC132949788 n=1 Tax=Metopolophium dirhodum TaxID=44670 RepID=UPI00299059C7|nr:uncharacterized protein LOC132949788 [Metopolophium dirhodum]
MVRSKGKPDLFITFTCNPRWPEITENLAAHSVANDRPELVARVFNRKLQELLSDLTVNRVFGNVGAYVYTIEFQKRGLPHAHILVILAEDCKFRTAADVDDVVCAFLPDTATDRRLHDCVKSHIHGPCGTVNPLCPCMVNNSCSKDFSKAYVEETVYVRDGGYPKYLRPDDGRVVLVRGREVCNECVVPYNPYLLVKYDAHINVEIFTSTRDTSARQTPSDDCFRTICTAKVTWSLGFLFTWKVVRTCTLRRAKKKKGYRTKLYVTRNSRSS